MKIKDFADALDAANKRIAELESEVNRLRKSASGWESEALLRAQNSDFWQSKSEKLESALIEERAKLLYFAHVGDGEYCPEVLEEVDSLKERHMENAEDDLHSEGKI